MIDLGIYTAIDASINRAQEGLRVCEDILRFIYHSPLSIKFKDARHDLTAACSVFPAELLLLYRNVAADEQRFIDTASESIRRDVPAVFRANIHRAMEAMRSLEEFSKLFGESSGQILQKIRFSLYELEKSALDKTRRISPDFLYKGILYAVLDPLLIEDEEYLETAVRMVMGGVSVIQLNTWGERPDEMLCAAKRIASLCRDERLPFIVAGSAEIASLSGADGVFLETADIPAYEARRLLPDKIIGVAVHSLADLTDERVREADYISAGPVYNTTGRHGEFLKGAGLDFLREVTAVSAVPVMAAGGICPAYIDELAQAGCFSFLMRSALYLENQIEENCKRFVMEIERHFTRG